MSRLPQERLTVTYGGVAVAAGGMAVDHDVAAVAAHMEGRDLELGVDLGLGEGRAEVEVLHPAGTWCGVTYPEDRERAAATLRELVAAGLYPDSLWG